MESLPQNPEFRNNPENFHPKIYHYFHVDLTLFRPVEFSIKLHTIKSGWSIKYIEKSHALNCKNILFFVL